MPVKLTKYQLAEAQHRGWILLDDGARDGDRTMAGFYGFTDVTLSAFTLKLWRSKDTLDLNFQEAAALYGEMANALDIARDNLSDDPSFRKAVRSYENALDRIEAAYPGARRTAGLGWAKHLTTRHETLPGTMPGGNP